MNQTGTTTTRFLRPLFAVVGLALREARPSLVFEALVAVVTLGHPCLFGSVEVHSFPSHAPQRPVKGQFGRQFENQICESHQIVSVSPVSMSTITIDSHALMAM